MRLTTTASAVALTLFTASPLSAQLLLILDGEGNPINEQTITVAGDASASVLEMPFDVVLQGDVAREVDMVRYEESDCTGTQNYFCWGECWLPVDAGERPSWNAIEPVTLPVGVSYTGFHAYWKPMGYEMTCCFLFTWHATDDFNDSTWVRICFDSSPISVDEVAASAYGFEVFPNPATSDEVSVTLEAPMSAGRTEVVWYSALGNATRATPLPKGVGKRTAAVGDLAPGVWFAQLQVDGQVMATRRVVIH